MGACKVILWCLCLATVSGELFGSMSGLSGGNFTDLGEVHIDVDESTITNSLAVNEYKVTNLTLEELPAAYRSIAESRKRAWHSDVAFNVVGGVVAATGMAGAGKEFHTLDNRQWFTRDSPANHHDGAWKRGQLENMFNKLFTYAFVGGLAYGSIYCDGRPGDWVKDRVANVFGTGPTPDPRGDSKGKRGNNKQDVDANLAYMAAWAPYNSSALQYDSDQKRNPDDCVPTQGALIKNYRENVPNTPTGTTVKVTCKAYTDFGYCDQLHVGTRFLTEMVKRGKTEGTFTVYNHKTRMAHMRCSVSALPYFFNRDECPFELPGDSDGSECKGCPAQT